MKRDDMEQLNLFEEELSANIEITELYGSRPGGVFEFIAPNLETKTIKTCYGDIIVMCNALEDYANILNGAIDAWELTGFHAAMYKLHAARCREISARYQKRIGYDYHATMAKCRKKRKKSSDNVGEDALVLATRDSL